MVVSVLDHVQEAFLSPRGGPVLFHAAVADGDDKITALLLLEETGIDSGNLGTVHPGQVRVLAVAVGLLAFQSKQTHPVACYLADGVVFGSGLGVGPGTKSIGAQVIGADVGAGIRDRLAVGVVFDEHIGYQQLGQFVVDPVAQPVFPGVDPGVFDGLIAHVEFVVAQGAEIYLHFGQGQDLPALLIAVLVRSSLGVVTTVQGQGFAKGSVAYPGLCGGHSRHAAGDPGRAVRTHDLRSTQIGVDIVAQQQHDIAFVGGVALRVRPGTAHESGSHSSSGSGGGCQLQETFPRNLFHDSVLLLTVSWYRVILVMMDGNGHSPIGSLGLLYFRCTRKNAEKIPTLQKEKDAPQAERGCCASLILSRRTCMESLYLIL